MTDEERSTLAREAARARWATERRGLEEEQQGHAGSRRPDDLGWLLRRRNVTECPPSLTCSRLFSESFPVAGKLKPAHRPQIVAMAFRTTSTAPRIVAITTTTAAARHTAKMSFSMGVRSGLLASSPFQEQALRSNGRGAPEQSTTPRFCEASSTTTPRPRARAQRAAARAARDRDACRVRGPSPREPS